MPFFKENNCLPVECFLFAVKLDVGSPNKQIHYVDNDFILSMCAASLTGAWMLMMLINGAKLRWSRGGASQAHPTWDEVVLKSSSRPEANCR